MDQCAGIETRLEDKFISKPERIRGWSIQTGEYQDKMPKLWKKIYVEARW